LPANVGAGGAIRASARPYRGVTCLPLRVPDWNHPPKSGDSGAAMSTKERTAWDPRLWPYNSDLRRLRKEVLERPTLKELDARAPAGLQGPLRSAYSAVAASIRPAIGAYVLVVLAYYGLLIWGVVSDNLMFTSGVTGLAMIFYVLILIRGRRIARLNAPAWTMIGLVRLIAKLEDQPERWADFSFRRGVNADVESLARRVEGLPQATGARDPASILELQKWAAGVASWFRQLKLWVAWPNPFTYTDLLHELARALELTVQGRWRELPTAAAPEAIPGPSRVARAAWFLLGLALLAATGLGLAYSAKLGPAATFLAPLVGVVALTALTKAGLSLQNVVDSKKALDSLRGDGK
jgi:hypothetical protein